MRVISLHADVMVLTSRIWQTNCTIVRAPAGPDGADAAREAFAIDSPILPDELEALPALLEQTGFALSGLLATHADWDHLLARLTFPEAALGVAETTAARLRGGPGEAQRELRAFDEEHYVQRDRPLTLGSIQALPVPGRCELGVGAARDGLGAVPERLAPGGAPSELECHPAEGHTADGMAIWIPWAEVLVAGDYLSSVEIPYFADGGGTLSTYIATLERLRALVVTAKHVVPGHGPVLGSEAAASVLEEDLAYLRGIEEQGAEVALPAGRRTKFQRGLHDANMASLRA